ncbi:MAG: cysteine hydrolase [Bacilli bacterium]|nr:cysteine hydrolase [Bacilli bacterium]
MRLIEYEMEYFENQRKQEQLEQERIQKGILNPDEVEKALYIIDMNNGFVNFGAMANPAYNALVPEQLRMIKKIRRERGQINFILEGHNKDALEFKSYLEHCVIGTKEAELVPELLPEQSKVNTNTYYKNCINGMLTGDVVKDIQKLKALREVIFEGVCADLCVMDFARTYARYLDQINKEVKLFVVKNAIDTFDAPGHNRQEWLDIAYKVMAQAGIHVVENYEELEAKEKTLGLRR